MPNIFLPTTETVRSVETTPMMATLRSIRKDVIPAMPVMTNRITTYSHQWAFITGVELVSPVPIVNGLIRLYVIVPFAFP